ncbi:flavin-nucleotide-binding protein [Diplodia corticola]|uniref:Flavin-nucleotide-binding protein n=1 Tax=Diplodia corticola TaxID=236234 RepID=A0A1J9SM28_9PEZI|nr:flavin-nucleotide-binding protein [Diplodia corticola]OJD40780.1 flavin-nucleotide-binding protein [Diplodia corticola]
MGEAYTQESYTKFNRHKERGTYDAEAIHNIVNTTSVLHVSFTDPASPFPTMLPMIGQIGQYEADAEPHLYLHGYVSSRIMKVTSSSDDEPQGLPMTVTATKVDGLVLALSPFSHSYNYRSAIIFGHAALLPSSDSPETLYAMELITDSVVPGRWQHTRVPPTASELTSTRIIKVRIASATAKVRAAPASSERRDLKDPNVVGKVWQGVVPVWEHFGKPVTNLAPGGVETIPEHVAEFIEAENANSEEYAVGVAEEKEKKKDDDDDEE